jgi:NTE family protein
MTAEGKGRTALILGGGGPIGIAWEAGLLMGLRDRGVDLARVDRIVGTSAGSLVGAHLAVHGSLDELYAAQSTPLDPAIKPPKMLPLLAAMTKAKLFTRSVQSERRSLGESARRAKVPGEQAWLDAIASFLPQASRDSMAKWPDCELLLTAIDAQSGELVTWNRNSGVPLPVAVASSCAVPCVYPLVHIHGRAYMDGGMGSPTNAALGSGYDLVIIADPLARIMGRLSPRLKEVEMLRGQGSQIVTFAFDTATADVIGMNLMDVRKREQVARSGRSQGQSATEFSISNAPGRVDSAMAALRIAGD